jgi:hypothetical protein
MPVGHAFHRASNRLGLRASALKGGIVGVLEVGRQFGAYLAAAALIDACGREVAMHERRPITHG